MEITVECMSIDVATHHGTSKIGVTLTSVDVDTIVDGLIDNKLEGVDIHQLLDAVGVANVTEWLRGEGYTVTENE